MQNIYFINKHLNNNIKFQEILSVKTLIWIIRPDKLVLVNKDYKKYKILVCLT